MSTQQINPQTIWRTSGGDNSRLGLFPKGIKVNPNPARIFPAHGSIQASVVLDKNAHVYIADMAGWIQVFSSQGDLLWKKPLDGGISATPVLNPQDTLLFVGTHRGWVYALHTKSGEILWKKEIPTTSDSRILSDFLFAESTNSIVLNSWGGKFFQLDARNGEVLHSWDAGISPYAGAACDETGAMYCIRSAMGKGMQLVRISPTGKASVLFTHPEGRKKANRLYASAMPVVDVERKRVYFVTNEDRNSLLHAWSYKENRDLWTRPFLRHLTSTPALMKNGSIVVPDLNGFIHCITQDNQLQFRYKADCEFLLASAVCADDRYIYFGDPLGFVHQVNNQGIGQPIFEAERAIQSRPSFDSSGRLYVPSMEGKVYVFEPA